jgi:hypothetical protein
MSDDEKRDETTGPRADDGPTGGRYAEPGDAGSPLSDEPGSEGIGDQAPGRTDEPTPGGEGEKATPRREQPGL